MATQRPGRFFQVREDTGVDSGRASGPVCQMQSIAEEANLTFVETGFMLVMELITAMNEQSRNDIHTVVERVLN